MYFENEFISINIDSFPLIYVNLKAHIPTDNEFEDMLYAVTASYAKEGKRIFILDLTKLKPLSLSNQLKMAAWTRENSIFYKSKLAALAIIINSNIIRNIADFVLKTSGTNMPLKFFKSKEESFGYIKEKLKEITY